jgi:hypothetical protein
MAPGDLDVLIGIPSGVPNRDHQYEALHAARLGKAAYPEGIEAALREGNEPPPTVERPDGGRDYGPEPPGRTLA